MSGVSIIVPVLNEATRLPALLAHLAPLRDHAEVIVVDGGSTDGGAEAARALGWPRVLAAPRGRGGQMNAGAGAAKGRFLVFLHADTLLGAEHLAALRRAARYASERIVFGRPIGMNGSQPGSPSKPSINSSGSLSATPGPKTQANILRLRPAGA